MNNSFNEHDIRPEEYREGMEQAIAKDINFLSDRKDKFIMVNCPACGSNDPDSVFEKFGFKFEKCRKCGTVFMNPRATPEILNEFYAYSANYAYWNKYIFPSSETSRRERIVKPRVKKLFEICGKLDVPTDCLVEVGAGFGTFVEEVKKTGKFKKVIAIEPGKDSAESCRKRGVETLERSVENISSLQFSPNIVAAFEVIEHLYSPEDFIKNCRRLMAPNSIFIVTCPNYQGFEIATLGLVSESIDAEHINLFNPTSLQLLFERGGFEVLECFTPGELDADIVRNKVISGDFDVSGFPFLKTILFDKWDTLGGKFQSFLKENKLSSHMWLVAKNK
ncbi:class I SAM-dependent methyltransferase [Candidatus Giovannonibacteria bacterium]|nr:class I SAM-dependent methyltransferase [Candidatus Giovannonibacteria bacterium]